MIVHQIPLNITIENMENIMENIPAGIRAFKVNIFNNHNLTGSTESCTISPRQFKDGEWIQLDHFQSLILLYIKMWLRIQTIKISFFKTDYLVNLPRCWQSRIDKDARIHHGQLIPVYS